MKKILFSLMAIALVVGLVGAGAFAQFFDTETSSGNTFTAGTLDLTLAESGKVAFPLPAKPGDTASGTITVKNEGNLIGSLYVASSYVTADGILQPTEFPADMTADQVASQLVITTFRVGGVVPPGVTEGVTTVEDIVCDPTGVSLFPPYADPTTGEENGLVGNTGWIDYFDMNPNDSCDFVMALQFNPLAGNDYQADGITWTIEFLLTQK